MSSSPRLGGVPQVVAVLAATLTAGCTNTDGGQAAPSSPPSPSRAVARVLSCDDAIGTDPPSPPLREVIGIVALPVAPGSAALQTSRSGAADPAMRLFAKAGLVVRAGTEVEVSVTGPPLTTPAIGWGDVPSSPSRLVRVPACPRRGGRNWLDFPGGYWIDRPSCVTVTVAVGSRHTSVPVGVGTSCPGQAPPPEPTEP